MYGHAHRITLDMRVVVHVNPHVDMRVNKCVDECLPNWHLPFMIWTERFALPQQHREQRQDEAYLCLKGLGSGDD